MRAGPLAHQSKYNLSLCGNEELGNSPGGWHRACFIEVAAASRQVFFYRGGIVGFIAWILVGLIAGWLAGKVMGGRGFGVLGDIVVGIIGSLIGGFLASNLLVSVSPTL